MTRARPSSTSSRSSDAAKEEDAGRDGYDAPASSVAAASSERQGPPRDGGPSVGLGGTGERAASDPVIQPTLTLNEPGDRYEQEAERVADAVMRMAGPESTTSTGEAATARQAAAATRGSGKPLPDPTQSFFEERMGADFSGVRIHTGGEADAAARSVNARAYTLGSDVVMRSGEYRPHSRERKRLLAHELTHVMQQGGITDGTTIQRQTGGTGTSAQKGKGTQQKAAQILKKALPLLQGTLAQQQGMAQGQRVVSKGMQGQKGGKGSAQQGASVKLTMEQRATLDQMVETFSQFLPSGYGVLDQDGKEVKRSETYEIFRIVKSSRTAVGRPFEYRVRLYLSMEDAPMDGEFDDRPRGGRITIYAKNIEGSSPEEVALLLVHEAIHMLSDVQTKMRSERGDEAAKQTPSPEVARLLTVENVEDRQKKMRDHFSKLIQWINDLTPVYVSDLDVNQKADEWSDLVVEEMLAYIYSGAVQDAMAKYQASSQAKQGGAKMALGQTGFRPLDFMSRYLMDYWLESPERRNVVSKMIQFWPRLGSSGGQASSGSSSSSSGSSSSSTTSGSGTSSGGVSPGSTSISKADRKKLQRLGNEMEKDLKALAEIVRTSVYSSTGQP